MLAISIITALATASSVYAIPHDKLRCSSSSTNASIIYYQGGSESAPCGGFAVATGALLPNTCHAIKTYGISIAQSSTKNCTHTLFSGAPDCGNNTSIVTRVPIPAGNDSVCLEGGILDGGKFEHASGIWSCL